MKRWSSSGIAVEVKVPAGDQGVASMREDLPALLQHAGVDVEPTLDTESDSKNRVVGSTFLGTHYRPSAKTATFKLFVHI